MKQIKRKGLLKQSDIIWAVSHISAIIGEACGTVCEDLVAWTGDDLDWAVWYWPAKQELHLDMSNLPEKTYYALIGYCVSMGLKYEELC